MGQNPSKRVETTLLSSPSFVTACDAVFADSLAAAEHAFPLLRPYQLHPAALRLHVALSDAIPLIRRWVPLPPSRTQVDAAYRRVAGASSDGAEEGLGSDEFKAFAAELFRDAVLSGAGAAVLRRVPIGVAGIAGIGLAARVGNGVVGRVMGIYAAGVAAAVYFSLG
ncbi:uncharacterized protein [Typha latifolia]|uniref:uncharacterized protein n=1 Tax=Typha latifolia TaxID=4733 RepID=UPI003C2D1DEC